MTHVCHRPQFAGKCAYLIASAGASPASHTLRTMNLALRLWGYAVIGKAGFKTCTLMKKSEIQSKYYKKLQHVARRILTAAREKKYLKPSFLALMIFKIQQLSWSKTNRDFYDYKYWQRQGWTNPRTTYFIPHKARFPKVALARMIGAFIAKLVAS